MGMGIGAMLLRSALAVGFFGVASLAPIQLQLPERWQDRLATVLSSPTSEAKAGTLLRLPAVALRLDPKARVPDRAARRQKRGERGLARGRLAALGRTQAPSRGQPIEPRAGVPSVGELADLDIDSAARSLRSTRDHAGDGFTLRSDAKSQASMKVELRSLDVGEGGLRGRRAHRVRPVKKPKAIGRISQADARAAINALEPTVRYCHWQGTHGGKKDLSGRLALAIEIDEHGQVTLIEEDAGHTLPGSSVVNCMVRAIQRMKFPDEPGRMPLGLSLSWDLR